MHILSLNKGFLAGHCKKWLPCRLVMRYSDLSKAERDMLLSIDLLHGSSAYLKSMENSTHKDFDLCYAVFELDKKLEGVATFQRSQVSVVLTQAQGALSQLVTYFINGGSNSKMWTADVLSNGDIYGAGIKGFHFDVHVDQQLVWYSLLEASRMVCKAWSFKPHFIVFRDYIETKGLPFISVFRKSRFHEIRTEPAMILKIQNHWKTFDDYKAALKTKYRTKVNASLERISSLEKRALSSDDIRDNLKQMDKLYRNVYDRSDFRPGKFNPLTFLELSKNLGENCHCQAYFLNGEMLAFQMGLSCCDHFDSMFVGMNYDYLKTHALLPGMLCEFIRWGIEHGVNEIRFGRTAAELKSSLGAEPFEIITYSRHTNTAANSIMPWVIDRMKPIRERNIHAFKQQTEIVND